MHASWSYIHVYLFTSFKRERDRDRDRAVCVCVCVREGEIGGVGVAGVTASDRLNDVPDHTREVSSTDRHGPLAIAVNHIKKFIHVR
jgi:hypothetical protein